MIELENIYKTLRDSEEVYENVGMTMTKTGIPDGEFKLWSSPKEGWSYLSISILTCSEFGLGEASFLMCNGKYTCFKSDENLYYIIPNSRPTYW